MTKIEFLDKLTEFLGDMPAEDIESSKQFYSELIDDSMEEGKSEEEAVAALGSPEEIAKQILSDKPADDAVKAADIQPDENAAPAPAGREINTAAVILIIVLFPIWIGPAATLLSIYVTLWAVIVSLYASAGAMVISGLAALVLSPLAGAAANIVLAIGIALILIGLGLFLILLMNLLTKLYVKFTVWAFKGTVGLIDKGVHK